MGTTTEVVKEYLGDLTRLVRLGDPQTYKELTIVPLLLKEEQSLDIISLRKGEEAGTAFVQERTRGASVSELEVINQGMKPVLLPFMQTITGGRQDRTVIEPILVPVGRGIENPLIIPVRCIESGRWSTQAAPDLDIPHFPEAAAPIPTKARAQRFRAAKMRPSPSLNYMILDQSTSQSAVWESIETYSSKMALAAEVAPSRSYLHMQRAKDSEIQEYAGNPAFEDQEEQCGLAVLVGTQVVGMELYGNTECWHDFRTEVLNGFATEVLLRKDKVQGELDRAAAHQTVLTAFDTVMEFTERAGTGLGTVVEFRSGNRAWYGICLIHDGRPAHFYVAYRSVLDRPVKDRRRLRSAALDRVQIQQQLQINPEILSQLDPREFPSQREE
ncbi:MAG: ARPP-1 family domain-containing protein [Candidatus Heimdallarchaeota archaeon]